MKVTHIAAGILCFNCHQDAQAQFSLPSHHPLKEGRVSCVDCHNAHGGFAGHDLLQDSVKETCVQCHSEKRGPFLYEHADVTEDCINCHSPHGSVNNKLLNAREPFLCLQCHDSHRINTDTGGGVIQGITLERGMALFTRCTDCHSSIHGSDVPSTSGNGRFTQ